MPSFSNEIEKAYRYCETVTKTHAKSFYFAAKFLPKPKQKAVYPIYAFCRHVDDAVDDEESSSEEKVVETIEKWKVILDEIYQIAETKDQRPKTKNQNLILLAWQDLLNAHKIPQNLPLELMQGVLMDTHTKRYESFDELYVYCYRVASTVGLMSSEILGYSDKIALRYAEALGIAMQLTNILRDVKEDAAIGRIYLPQEDLRKFGVSKEQIFAGEMSENFIKMMKFQIERARDYYRTGENGISLLEKDSRFTVLLASRIYARILDEIERQNYDVFTRRAHTTSAQKLLSIPKIWSEARKL
jgi:phytoene synthase